MYRVDLPVKELRELMDRTEFRKRRLTMQKMRRARPKRMTKTNPRLKERLRQQVKDGIETRILIKANSDNEFYR